jgi:hypothetical protein
LREREAEERGRAASALDRPQSTGHYALGTRLAGTFASFVASILIVILLSPERIGVFLTIGSLAAFSAILDLGINYSFLLATAAHGEKEAPGLIAAATTAMIPATALSSLILFAGGAIFLSQVGLGASLWLAPWLCYCAIIAPLQVLMLRVSYIEGTGRRDAAWRAHFYIEVVAGIGLLVAIALRLELWAFATAALFRVAMILVLLRNVFWLPRSIVPSSPIRARLALWHREIWPMQWKNLMNNLSGLLTTRLLTPILFAAQGAATAGRLGFVIAVALSMISITAAWPLSKSALYSSLYHQGLATRLLADFRMTLIRSALLALAFVLAVGVTCEILRRNSAHMANQLPEPAALWLILLIAVCGHLTYSFAILIRAQRKDPVVVVNFFLNFPALAACWIAATIGQVPFAATFLTTSAVFTVVYGAYLRSFIANLKKAERSRAVS